MGRLADAAKALLGVSTYQKPTTYLGGDLGDRDVEAIRASIGGGQLARLPTTQTRWYLADLEAAQLKCDVGDISMAARLWSAMRSDGTAWGLRRTLTSGLVRLPRRFYGDADLIRELEAENGTRSTFDDMFPPAELALMADDGYGLGVAVGELVKVQGRDFPVLVRLEPEFLYYRWSDNRWFYKSIAGLLPITPGDGRWILHLPGGRVNPWRNGAWRAVGRSYINKEHAMLHRSNFSAKLANPARAATAPMGATEEQRVGFLSRVIAWGINTVFELPVGWDVKLIESNGRGYEVFKDEIAKSDEEMMISIAGQVVTTTGGAGFSNADIHRVIRNDIVQDVGDALGYTLNTQGLPAYSLARRGTAWQEHQVTVKYVTAAPKDHQAQATTMVTVANGIAQARAALAPDGLKPEVQEITTRFDLPVTKMTPEEKARAEAQAPQLLTTTESAQKVQQDAAPKTAGDPGTTKQEQRDASDDEDEAD